MRKLSIIGLVLFMMIGCKSVALLQNKVSDTEQKKITINTDVLKVNSANKWFTEDTEFNVIQSGMVKKDAEFILTSIKRGYSNQIPDFIIVGNNEGADVTFQIKQISVDSKSLTFNITKPGPFYVMEMDVDIFSEDELISTITKKKTINMAEIVYPKENIKWMNADEKNEISNQLLTFKQGLRQLYQDIYFEAFGISLQI